MGRGLKKKKKSDLKQNMIQTWTKINFSFTTHSFRQPLSSNLLFHSGNPISSTPLSPIFSSTSPPPHPLISLPSYPLLLPPSPFHKSPTLTQLPFSSTRSPSHTLFLLHSPHLPFLLSPLSCPPPSTPLPFPLVCSSYPLLIHFLSSIPHLTDSFTLPFPLHLPLHVPIHSS